MPKKTVETKHCNKCDAIKDLDQFHKDKSKSDGLSSWCIDCKKEYREQHFEHLQEVNKVWREANSEHIKVQQKEWHEKNKEAERRDRAENGDEIVKRALQGRSEISEKKCARCEIVKPIENFSFNRQHKDGAASWCKECQALYLKEIRHRYLPQKNASAKVSRANLRLEVLQYYSGVFPFCECCGEDRIEFLSLDHINGGGSEHKRQVKHVYKWIRDNNFPEGFRVLCHNCNQSRGAYGYCPHEKEREDRTKAA